MTLRTSLYCCLRNVFHQRNCVFPTPLFIAVRGGLLVQVPQSSELAPRCASGAASTCFERRIRYAAHSVNARLTAGSSWRFAQLSPPRKCDNSPRACLPIIPSALICALMSTYANSTQQRYWSFTKEQLSQSVLHTIMMMKCTNCPCPAYDFITPFSEMSQLSKDQLESTLIWLWTWWSWSIVIMFLDAHSWLCRLWTSGRSKMSLSIFSLEDIVVSTTECMSS